MSSSINVVFILSPIGTFTPTNSGALATNIRECAIQARIEGFNPIVISRSSPPQIPSYQDISAHFIPYPEVRGNSLAAKIGRFERKWRGWRHVGQFLYMKRVARVLIENNLLDSPFYISNDPDLVVFLRQIFPKIHLIHRFHNQMESKSRVKALFPKSVDCCVAVSEFTRRWVAQYYGLPAEKTSTVYNGVNLSQFQPADATPPLPPVLNFVGRTGKEKAPDILLQAALLLKNRGREFALQLVGSNHWGAATQDEYQLHLNVLVTQLEAQGVPVRRPGHIDRFAIASEFARAHIHVVPSRWDEPFGLTTLEGMASGLATVASRTGGSPEIIGEGEQSGGLLFERDDANDLAAQIEPWLSDEKLRRQFARRARQRAENFSWGQTWQGLKALGGL